ncbi:MAG: ABC transporter permease [Thermoguttaceae bacterium]
MRRAWKIALLSLAGLRRTPLRVAITASGVAIASGALVSMMAFAVGLQRQLETPLRLLSLLNDINVSPEESKDGRSPPLDDAAVERLGRLPGVAAAFPNIRVRGVKVRHGTHSEPCLAAGAPREAWLLGVSAEILVAGRFFNEGRDPEAIVGAPLLGSLGFASPDEALGATLTLEAGGLSPDDAGSFSYQRKELSVRVVGVFDLPMIVPGPIRRGIILPVDLMKQVPGIRFETALSRLKAGDDAAPGYANVIVRVRDLADLAAVDRQIKELGFRTTTMLSRVQEMQTFLIFLEVVLAAVGTVALVVAALGIANTLLMAVLERYQEIGIYKSIGASYGDLLVLFLTEAGIIGLLGGSGGLLLGRIVSCGLDIAVNAFARRHGITEPMQVFVFPAWLLAGTVLFAVLASVLAGVYPALRAARVDPIRALRRG